MELAVGVTILVQIGLCGLERQGTGIYRVPEGGRSRVSVPVVRLADWWGALCFGGVGAPAAKDDHLPTARSYLRHNNSHCQSIAAAFNSCTSSLALFSQADFSSQTLSSRSKSCSRRPQILQRCWELFGAEVVGGLGYWTITSNQYYQGGREDKPRVSQEPPKFYGTEDAYLPAIMA